MKPKKQLSDELDEQLRSALREEDAELLARLDTDPGILETALSGFRGRNAWCVNFFGAQSVDDRVLWGVSLTITATMAGTLKMILWSHVERAMLRREIKRVELQVATLSLLLKERP